MEGDGQGGEGAQNEFIQVSLETISTGFDGYILLRIKCQSFQYAVLLPVF